jgi:hypothetical protein
MTIFARSKGYKNLSASVLLHVCNVVQKKVTNHDTVTIFHCVDENSLEV